VTEQTDPIGPFKVVITEPRDGEYLLEVQDENGNTLDADTLPFDFYRDSHYWKPRIKGLIEDVLDEYSDSYDVYDGDEYAFDFAGQWRDMKSAWYETFSEREKELRQGGEKRDTEPEEKEEEIPDELKEQIEQEAEEILKSKKPVEKIQRHLDNIIAGEGRNKTFLFLNLLSGIPDDPSKKQIILISGHAGGGKSTLMNIADAFKVKDVGRFTQHALDYSDLEGYQVLRLKEIGKMDEEEQGVSTLKFLSSDDRGYKVEYTVKDEETGRFDDGGKVTIPANSP